MLQDLEKRDLVMNYISVHVHCLKRCLFLKMDIDPGKSYSLFFTKFAVTELLFLVTELIWQS